MRLSEKSRRNRGLWYLAWVLLLHSGVYGQAGGPDQARLRGLITESDTGIPNVHILNLSAEVATISDARGYFELPASVGDTILLSAIRYERKTFQVRPEMLHATELHFELQPFVNQLDEVVLRPYNLSGDLNQDLSNLPVEEAVNAYSLKLPNANTRVKTQAERKLFEATSGAGLIPLNPVLNALSGRTRMLKKRLARDRAYQRTEAVRRQYPDSLFVKELGIPLIRIPDFMYFCEVDPAFSPLAESGDELRMWEFLKKKGQAYRSNNGL